jgi:hypothetical protein
MNIPLISRLLAVALVFFSVHSWAEPELDSFESAEAAFVQRAQCEGSVKLPPSYDHGELANCILGEAGTVVWELEQSPVGTDIRRVKLTWLDFDIRPENSTEFYDTHADQDSVREYLAAFLDVYAPCRKDELMGRFFSNRESTASVGGGYYQVAIRQFHNPNMTERTIEITPVTR